MVARCSALHYLQPGTHTMGLIMDSSRNTGIGAEGGKPDRIWAATLTSHPPQGGSLAKFGQQGFLAPRLAHTVGGVGTRLVHYHPSTHLDLLLHHPLLRKASR